MHAADFRALAVGENVEVTTATAIATDSDSRRAGGIFELGKGESHTFCTGSTGLGLALAAFSASGWNVRRVVSSMAVMASPAVS